MLESPAQPVVCVIGFPIAGNPAQFCISRAFADLKLDWLCLSVQVSPEALQDALRGTEALHFVGLLVDPPHQQPAARWLLDRSDNGSKPPVGTPPPASRYDGMQLAHDQRWFGCNFLAAAIRERIQQHEQRVGTPLVASVALDDPATEVLADLATLGLPKPLGLPEPVSPPAPTLLLRTSRSPAPNERPVRRNPPANLITPPEAPFHPDSLLIELPHPDGLASTVGTNRPALPGGITAIDLAVDRLVIAINQWTGCEPNRELIAEAMEEYLEI